MSGMTRWLFTTCVLSAIVSACGTYVIAGYMYPEAGGGWEKPGIGVTDRKYSCSAGGLVIVKPVLFRARRVAQSLLGIPVPGTSSKESQPDAFEPIRITLSFGPNFDVNTCGERRVWIHRPKEGDQIYPSTVTDDAHNRTRGLHFCSYTFVPMNQIGGDFYLHFPTNMLDCQIKPLRFSRYEGRSYLPGSTP